MASRCEPSDGGGWQGWPVWDDYSGYQASLKRGIGEVRIDSVGHCYSGHRHARLQTRCHDSGFEFVDVNATASTMTNGLLGDSVHVSTKS